MGFLTDAESKTEGYCFGLDWERYVCCSPDSNAARRVDFADWVSVVAL
jgi:hypothetical protein